MTRPATPVRRRLLAAALVLGACALPVGAQDLIVLGETVHTVAGDPLRPGVITIRDGRIESVLTGQGYVPPEGVPVLRAPVVTPGFVDAHATVGLAGFLNQDHDNEELERSEPLQPELRALDAFNMRDPLVPWLASFGVTTVHTGHAPGSVISGDTLIVKLTGGTVEDGLVRASAMVCATLGDGARDTRPGKAPGTRAKAAALLRQALADARSYVDKRDGDDPAAAPERDLRQEALGRVLTGEVPLLVTAHRHHDILAALRIAEEFGIRLVLDGGAEAYTLTEQLLAAQVPVIVHPAMARTGGASSPTANLRFDNAALLTAAGIPIAQQSGYESYVPRTRVLPLEAAISVRYGLPWAAGLASITLDAARLLGIDERVGSLEPGKDADLALFDGDPFEYGSHCLATVIEGELVWQGRR